MKIYNSNMPESLEIPNQKLANLPLILVDVNGNKVPMVFDTGASMTVMNRSTVQMANIQNGGKEIVGSGNLGAKMVTNTSVIDEIRIGQIRISELEVIVVEDAALDFGFDEAGNALKIDGFLGWDVIQHFSWKVDRVNNTIEVLPSKKMSEEKNLFWDNMPIVPVKVDNDLVYFGFDTGNTESILSPKFNVTSRKTHFEKELILGLDGKAEMEVEKLDMLDLTICDCSIQLLNLTIYDRAIFPTNRYEVHGLLAADLIEGKVLWLDFQNNRCHID